MTSSVISLGPGSQLLLDGELVEVIELDGTRVTLRNVRTQALVVIGLTRLVAQARSGLGPADEGDTAGVTLAGFDCRAAPGGR